MTSGHAITELAQVRLPRELYHAWSLGRDAAELGLPVYDDPFSYWCPQFFTAWLLGYVGAPVGFAVPEPRGGDEA
ncbi:MAG: hypothetical protein GEU83_12070 [Pseudonocardiaceae bacterium]|nr:hypothetical protein [Pseudonocardiaceae bacterium]